MPPKITERKLILLIGAVQFVNVLDFMMVMPLGPDFARALGIPTSELGLVGASYTAAAAVSGILGALVLDRFDRRKALGAALVGLVLATALGGFTTDLRTMLGARVLAGAFGGPAAALSLAIVSDVVPAERRGRAMGAVMGAFAVASVLGVPAGLELARLGGWRLPFFAVAAVGAVLAATAILLLPPLTTHLQARPKTTSGDSSMRAMLARPTVMLSLLAMATLMAGNFALVPYFAPYWQQNLGYPRERLGLLYLCGGMVAFVTMRVAGRLADRVGAAIAAAGGMAAYLALLVVSFISPTHAVSPLLLFVAFMTAGSFRMVPFQALSSRVPEPQERARFMSAQSAVQHIAAASGALLASQLVSELPSGHLVGMDNVAWLAGGLGATVPLLLWVVESRVRRREQEGRDAARDEALQPETSPS